MAVSSGERFNVAAAPINIMVVGECGDGKSTLINGMRDHSKSEAALCGKRPAGVTENIVAYPCPDIDGNKFNILDTPGVGSHEVDPIALISMIEEYLKAIVPGGVRGVVVTTPVSDGRIRLGAHIVRAIVDKGFVASAGKDKYANIILCGMKKDKADSKEIEDFMTGVDGQPSLMQLFFKKSAKGRGPCVMVSQNDYTPLLDAIRNLPAMAIAYEKPESREMAAALAEKLGLEPGEFQYLLERMRYRVGRQSQDLKERIRRQMQPQQQQAQAHMARIELERAEADEEHRRVTEQVQEDHGPAMAAARSSSSDHSGRCFPASALLHTPAGPKRVADIWAGEKVLAVDHSGCVCFDDVYFFGHAVGYEQATFVCLRTSSGKVLRASPKHFIALTPAASSPRWSKTRFVYAETVKVGDCVWVIDASFGCDALLQCEDVVEVSLCMAEGLFNPYTLMGTVVVDEVVASAHSDWLLDELFPSGWEGKLPGFYQALFLPGRLL